MSQILFMINSQIMKIQIPKIKLYKILENKKFNKKLKLFQKWKWKMMMNNNCYLKMKKLNKKIYKQRKIKMLILIFIYKMMFGEKIIKNLLILFKIIMNR